MESFKPDEEAVDLWGEGHGFAKGASRLTGTRHCPSTLQASGILFGQAIASIGEMWKPS
jgi:hypothetical protein